MRPRLLLGVLIAVLAAWALPSAAHADHVCKSGKRYVSGSQAFVVVLNDHLWGCVRGQTQAFVVAYPVDFGGWNHVTVAGTYAALEISESSQECESRDVRLVNLRTGRTLTRPALATNGAGPCDGAPVSDLVLRSDGLVAFIAAEQVIRWSLNRKLNVLLDGGPGVDPRSLTFVRGGLGWTNDGQRKRADLPKRRR